MHRLPHRPTPRALALALASLFALFTLTALGAPILAQDDEADPRAEFIRANYRKFEARIPMRDGVRLFTSIYLPDHAPGQQVPILLFRTPYSVAPYGADRYRESLAPSENFEQAGYLFVFQDVRGKYMSEGEFVNMRPHRSQKSGPTEIDESTDTYDTIAWLLENLEGHNGKVGQWGISYPGFYTAAGAIDGHPALAAISPQAPIADWFWDDMHHNGAFILPLAFNFFSVFGQARPEPTTERGEFFEYDTADGYQFFLDLGPLKNVNEKHFDHEIGFWNDFVAHPNYDDFWQSRNLLPHLDGIGAAVMVVGGWFDTEDLYGPLNIYRSIEQKNPKIDNQLVMGPWSHGGWRRSDGQNLGRIDFGYPTSEPFQKKLFEFFEYHLRGEGEIHQSEAWMFETGANRWREFDQWPPAARREQSLYLGADGDFGLEPPSAPEDGVPTYDEFVSDPAKPVPYTMEITTRWARDYMTEDQRFAAWRPDVLVYRGEVLEDDLTLAGPVTADLWVSTTGGDADWIVKVIDVFPGEVDEDRDGEPIMDPTFGGYQMLVRAEVMRGRFRNSYEHPEPFEPGVPTRVRFTLNDFLHTFQRGHRLMIQVQSTWFPFVDRNPQSWVPNIFEAKESDFVKATHRVHRSPEHPSRLVVGVLPGLGEGE